jgi:hypothetical protein
MKQTGPLGVVVDVNRAKRFRRLRGLASATALRGVAFTFVACGEIRGPGAEAFVSVAPTEVPFVDPGFPAAPRGAEVYARMVPYNPGFAERYVLLGHDTFVLEMFSPRGIDALPGRYARKGDAITFRFAVRQPSTGASRWIR